MFPEQHNLSNSLCSATVIHDCQPLGENIFLPVDKHVGHFCKNLKFYDHDCQEINVDVL